MDFFKKILRNLSLNKILIIGGIISSIFIIAFFIWFWRGKDIVIDNSPGAIKNNFPTSSISGIHCENSNYRPIAVMLPSDPITRPLSGISQADVVFEMPVTPGGVTRMMALYQCEEPEEIGSIRSAREDFIPLAAGFNAIYAHWGGERIALEKLNSNLIDNIDALKYETTYFYRKSEKKQPHNGFSGFDKLLQATNNFKYNRQLSFEGYLHDNTKPTKNLSSLIGSISIDYPPPYNILWEYDPNKNTYKRSRGGDPEIDNNNSTQVEATVIIIMKTTSKFINKDYINIITTGRGELEVYQNGVKISGTWSKLSTPLDSKLFFYNNDGTEIEFTPGKMWVEIVTN